MDIENIRHSISEFLKSYLDGTPQGDLDNGMILKCIGKLIMAGVFTDLDDMQRELLREQGVLISFDHFFMISK